MACGDLRRVDRWIVRCVAISTAVLPILLVAGNVVVFDGHVEPSISDFYYGAMRPALVVGLCTIGGLLLIFRGRAFGQQMLSIAAGICMSVMAVCPTVRPGVEISPANVVHVAAAATFGITAIALVAGLGSVSVPLDRRAGSVAHRARTAACVLMTLCFALAAADLLLGLTAADSTLLFWLETLGLTSFGTGWLVSSMYPALRYGAVAQIPHAVSLVNSSAGLAESGGVVE